MRKVKLVNRVKMAQLENKEILVQQVQLELKELRVLWAKKENKV